MRIGCVVGRALAKAWGDVIRGKPRISLWRILIAGGLLMVALSGCVASQFPPQPTVTGEVPVPEASAPLRVFWVNSHTLDQTWSLQMRIGILDALNRAGYKYSDDSLVWNIYNLGVTHVMASSDLVPSAERAIAAIQNFEPDVVIISDDEAAEVIVPRYPDPEMKFVLTGVHPEIGRRGLLRDNVIAVVEEVYPEQTVTMAQTLLASEQGTYLIIGDNSTTGQVYARRAYDALLRFQYEHNGPPPVLGIAGDWDAWKELVLGASEDVDFILIANYMPLPGVPDTPAALIPREPGDPATFVSEADMMRWTLGYAPVPVFALTGPPVAYGAVGGLVTNGYEQGYLAGEMAVQFVVEGAPDEPLVVAPNRLTLNAAAARYWELPIPILFPIAAEVHEYLPSVQGGL